MPSNDFNLDQVSENQNNKYLTINTAIQQLANAIGSDLEVDMTTGNVSLTNTEWRQTVMFYCNPGSSTRTLTVPALRHLVFIQNTGYGVVAVTRGATVINVEAGDIAIIWADGTQDGLLYVGGTGVQGVTTFLGLSDTPASFASQALKLLRVNATSDAVEFTDHSFDISLYAGGVFVANETVFKLVTARNFKLPQNLTGSKGVVDTAPNDNQVFDIQKNGVSIGSITVAGGTGAVTFTFATEVSFSSATPDVLTIVAPSSVSYEWEGLSLTLLGTRTA